MKLKFIGDLSELAQGIDILKTELSFNVCDDGIPVKIERSTGNIEVTWDKTEATINYNEKIHFFRALGLLIEGMQQNSLLNIVEEPQFTLNGAMFDVSRNAVLTVESIKKMLRKMSVMGLNMMMLYTEDTYTLKDNPYFGYMRGKYSNEELKEADDYAYSLGIEMIPCIQTLAHLTEALKWKYAQNIKDTADILLADNEETYNFIEEMVCAASAPFRSNRIHIGMDEAHNLGLGKYLDQNGYHRRFDIMNQHLEKVKIITENHGLKPMIWSDMYFRLASETGAYYDLNAEIPEDVIKAVPENTQLVYWDYYHIDKDFYAEYIKKHKKFGTNPVFAGGVWTWNGICPNYYITFTSTNAALSACKEEGVNEVFATLWGDNGAETNAFTGLLGLQLYAEHGYSKEFSMDKLKKRFKFCTGLDYEAFMDLTNIEETPVTDKNAKETYNPSKFILWQDILQGLFDKNIEGFEMGKHYSEMANNLKKHSENHPQWSFIFDMYQELCSALSIKSEIGIEIKNYYDKKDMDNLDKLAKQQLPELYKKVETLRIAHRNLWFTTNKPFGWDILDIRYGGLLARIDTAITRLSDYVAGNIQNIPELEEEKLYFNGPLQSSDNKMLHCNQYSRIVSACPLG